MTYKNIIGISKDILENFNSTELASMINIKVLDDNGDIFCYGVLTDTSVELYISELSIKQSDRKKLKILFPDIEIRFSSSVYFIEDNKKISEILSLDDKKQIKLEDFKQYFKSYIKRPVVEVATGIYLDGGRDDILNFEGYRDILLATGETSGTIKGAYDDFYSVSIDDLSAYIMTIKQRILELYTLKWQKEQEILGVTNDLDLENITFDI